MKKYYEVKVKAGHVGRGYYVEKSLFIMAKSGKDAAGIARMIPRVKHDDKHAIINVTEINYDTFVNGTETCKQDPYFIAHNSQEQKINCHSLDIIKCEYRNQQRHNTSRLEPLEDELKHNKNHKKYQTYFMDMRGRELMREYCSF